MPLSDRDIIITPNRGASSEPIITLRGADVASSATMVMRVINSGTISTLSFEGTSGQLFAISDTLTGSIFSVNDVSGIPSIEVLDNGLVKLAEYNGFVRVGSAVNNQNATSTTTGELQVVGGVGVSRDVFVGGAMTVVGTLNAAVIAGSITNAANIGITDDPSNGATMYPTFVSATSGNQAIRVDSSGLVWIPSTNRLGIGTTEPLAPLQIGAKTIENTFNNSRLILAHGASTEAPASGNPTSVPSVGIEFNRYWSGGNDANRNIGGIYSYGVSNWGSGIYMSTRPVGSGGTPVIRMVVNHLGNVGIGSVEPLTRLHVEETGANIVGGNAVRASTMRGITLTNTNNDDSSVGVWFGTGPGSHWSGISGQRTNSAANWGTDLRFFTHEDATNDLTFSRERVRISSAGNVGIGTQTPGSGTPWGLPVLEVSGSRGTLVLRTTGASGLATLRMVGPSASSDDDWHINMSAGATSTLNFAARAGGGTTGLVLRNDGNVGIGTTSPNRKLTISRASEAASEQLEFRVEGGISTGNYDGIVWTQGATGATTLGSIRLNYNSSGQPDMAFNLRADSNLLFLRNGGSVGISTATPAAKLHIVSSVPTGIGAVPAGTTAIMDAVGNNYLLFRSTADNNSRAGLVFQDNNVGGFVVFNNFSGVNGSDSMIYGTWQDHIFVNGTSEVIGMGGKTERMRITNAGGLSFNAAGTGSSGQILQSNGNAPPTWVNPSSIAGGNADLLDGLDSTAFLRRDITNTMFAGQTSSLAFENQTTFFRFAFNELRFWDNQVGDIFGLDEHAYATTSMRAPIFFDRNDTAYFVDPNSQSSLWGVAIRGDNGSTNTDNQIFFWGSGNTTTSAIGFKANGGQFTNPTGNGDGFNTYLTMDSDGRGWVFRRGTGGNNFTSAFTSGWILNNGVWQANTSMRAPIFFDSNDTAFYIDPNTTALSINVRGEMRNPSMWVNDGDNFNSYNENIRLFNAPNGVSVIAFSASGTSGTPTTSILGYSDRMERRFQDNWQDRMFNGYVEASGSYRAPIFFDSNNTAFYTDPASTSILNNLTVTGTTNLGSSVVVSGNNVLTTNLNTTPGDRGWDLHGNFAMQAIYGNHNPLNNGHIYNAALFRGGSWTMYGFNGSAWINLGTVAALTDGYGKADWGGVQLGRIYSQFIIDMGSTLGYTFMSALTLSHSTNGNSMNIFFENSTSNVYNSGTWNVMGQALGANSWPGGTSIKFSDVVGASFPNFARLRIVPTWGGLGNEISLGQLFITAAYGGGNQLLEWDSSYNVTAAGSYRSPIFFDSNNTAFYLDPNSTTISLNMAGSVRQATHNRPGILSVASGTASTGASFAIQQETGEGWTGIFVDFEPNTGWGLYHDNPNNFFSFTAETATGSIRSFAVPSRSSGNRTAHEKFRVDQTSGDTITGAIGFAQSSFRAPIFFDNNDTTYFMDPATNSRFGGQVVIAGNASGSAGNRLIVGSTTVNFSLQDGNLRPTIQATGQYPVISLNHTVTSNTNHGGTLQFTCNGVGNQFVIGTTGNGFALDMGYSSSGDWNPHNGIAGYLGTTFFRANTSGNIGIGAQGDWGGLGGGEPGWPIDTRGTLVNNTDIRAPIFYDSNNTAFYADPASTSVFNNLTVTGSLNTFQSVLSVNRINFTNTSGGQESDPYCMRWISESSARGAGLSWLEFQLNDDANEEIRIYGNSCAGFGCGAISDNLYHRFRADGYAWNSGVHEAGSDSRAPIFYDSNNTGRYLDPNSTSLVNQIRVASIVQNARYDFAAIEVREFNYGGTQADIWENAPRIGFHWGGRVASSIAMSSNGWINIMNNPGTGWETLRAAQILSNGEVTAFFSDARLKTKIGNIDNAVEKVKSIETFKYVNNELANSLGFTDTDVHIGVSAQSVEAVLPEVVKHAPFDMQSVDGEVVSASGEWYKTVKYDKLVPLLIEAIKEQQTTIDQLRAELDEMRELKKLVKEMLGK